MFRAGEKSYLFDDRKLGAQNKLFQFILDWPKTMELPVWKVLLSMVNKDMFHCSVARFTHMRQQLKGGHIDEDNEVVHHDADIVGPAHNQGCP